MAKAPRRFVVISGLPGSGKTTVARELAPLRSPAAFERSRACPLDIGARIDVDTSIECDVRELARSISARWQT